jgi:hypothetical protein
MRLAADLYLSYEGFGPILLTMIRTLLTTLRMHTAPSEANSVHFHQGPQGQPTPCFDERCPNPRLSA